MHTIMYMLGNYRLRPICQVKRFVLMSIEVLMVTCLCVHMRHFWMNVLGVRRVCIYFALYFQSLVCLCTGTRLYLHL